MVFEFDGTKYGKLRDMRAARRAKPPDPVRGRRGLHPGRPRGRRA